MRTALKKCIEEKHTNDNIKITMNNKSLLKHNKINLTQKEGLGGWVF